MPLVKVTIPVDETLLKKASRAYADADHQVVLVHDSGQQHMFHGVDEVLWKFMATANEGKGYVKAFMLAEWNGNRWVIDYAAGFQPTAPW